MNVLRLLISAAFAVALCLCFSLEQSSNAFAEEASKGRIDAIPVPPASLFPETIEPDLLNDVLRWITDAEADFLARDYDFKVSGDFGRVLKLNSVESIRLNHLEFRWLDADLGGSRRIVSKLQDLSGNQTLNRLTGRLTDGTFEIDTIESNGQSWLRKRPGNIREIEFHQLHLHVGYRPVFHPFRASITGVDQILGGSSIALDRHSVLRRTIKKALVAGDLTFVWLEIGGPQTSVKRLITFRNERPIQTDNWTALNEKTGKIIPYDSVYTMWKTVNETRVPVRLAGVRNSRVRPAEFDFTIDWRFPDEIDASNSEPGSLGTLSLYDKQAE